MSKIAILFFIFICQTYQSQIYLKIPVALWEKLKNGLSYTVSENLAAISMKHDQLYQSNFENFKFSALKHLVELKGSMGSLQKQLSLKKIQNLNCQCTFKKVALKNLISPATEKFAQKEQNNSKKSFAAPKPLKEIMFAQTEMKGQKTNNEPKKKLEQEDQNLVDNLSDILGMKESENFDQQETKKSKKNDLNSLINNPKIISLLQKLKKSKIKPQMNNKVFQNQNYNWNEQNNNNSQQTNNRKMIVLSKINELEHQYENLNENQNINDNNQQNGEEGNLFSSIENAPVINQQSILSENNQNNNINNNSVLSQNQILKNLLNSLNTQNINSNNKSNSQNNQLSNLYNSLKNKIEANEQKSANDMLQKLVQIQQASKQLSQNNLDSQYPLKNFAQETQTNFGSPDANNNFNLNVQSTSNLNRTNNGLLQENNNSSLNLAQK